MERNPHSLFPTSTGAGDVAVAVAACGVWSEEQFSTAGTGAGLPLTGTTGRTTEVGIDMIQTKCCGLRKGQSDDAKQSRT